MISTLSFFAVLFPLMETIIMVLAIYALVMVIKALQIYIRKNS